MKEKYYKFAPVLLALVGSIISFCFYFLYNFMSGKLLGLFWFVLIGIHIMMGFAFGKLIKRLNQRSIIDSLTRLYNRRYFYERISLDMERLKKSKNPLTIAIIDIDDFKMINDRYGHLEGDKALKAVAKIFKTNIRANDTVVRWGGDEFIIILPDMGIDGAKLFAERIRSIVENYHFHFKMTICIGLMSTREDIRTDEFLALADRALYMAKEKKNSVVTMSDTLYVEAVGIGV